MTPERWEEIKRVCDAALERDVTARSAFLADACAGDDALRREVESLLAQASAVSGFLSTPAVPLAGEILGDGSSLVGRQSGFGMSAGSSIAHYRILALAGAGGMGEVYKAEDTKLSRFVALKVMAPDAYRDPSAKRRFMQEARAASALDHHNICTVHDILETEDGRLVLVMSFYDGETLASRIKRSRLSFDEARSMIRQVATGLARAHEYGIVHRDIKPANLMMTRHRDVKILDFGLAKLKGDVSASQEGVIMGTPYYMSPEQIAGGPVDHRSDIWSLAVVLYESLLGRRPFRGSTIEAVLHSIVFDEFTDLLRIRPDAPDTLVQIVRRALIKSANGRFQSCHEILGLLDHATASLKYESAASREIEPRRSILVMPFVTLGGGKASEYLALGLTDEVTTKLSSLRALRVFARTAAERVSASKRSVRDVAGELDVEYVVEGAIRRQGKTLRVSANLTDVRTGALIWAEQFRGTVEDVFAIEESLAMRLVEALSLRLTGPEEEHLAQRGMSDVVAYECFLKAKQEFVRYSEHSLQRALSYIETAQARVGDNILLLAAAGQIYWQLVNSGVSLDRSYLAKASVCAHQILRLDPASPHGHRIMGMVALLEGNIRDGIRLLEAAAASDPNDTDTLSLLGPCYGFVGRPQIGMPWIKKLLEIDPLTPMYQSLPGILSLMAGAFDEATAPLSASWQMDPGNPLVGLCYGQSLALNQMTAAAIEVFDVLWGSFPGSVLAQLGQAYKYALRGGATEVAESVTAEVEAVAEWDMYHAWNLAECYALVDQDDKALYWLARAISRGFLNYPLVASLDPFLARVRPHPLFASIEKDVKKQWEELSGLSQVDEDRA